MFFDLYFYRGIYKLQEKGLPVFWKKINLVLKVALEGKLMKLKDIKSYCLSKHKAYETYPFERFRYAIR